MADCRKLQQKCLNTLGLPNKKKAATTTQSEQLARTQKFFFAKRKMDRALSPNHEIGRWERVKVGESRTLKKKEGKSESTE